MKTLLLILLTLTVAFAAEPAKPAGDLQGGRLLESAALRAEFFIRTDRRATVTFLDAANRAVARGTRSAVVKVEGVDVALEAQANGYVTKEPLPAKEPAPIVVQLRSDAATKPANFRLTLNTVRCGECKRAEYGCTCDH